MIRSIEEIRREHDRVGWSLDQYWQDIEVLLRALEEVEQEFAADYETEE